MWMMIALKRWIELSDNSFLKVRHYNNYNETGDKGSSKCQRALALIKNKEVSPQAFEEGSFKSWPKAKNPLQGGWYKKLPRTRLSLLQKIDLGGHSVLAVKGDHSFKCSQGKSKLIFS